MKNIMGELFIMDQMGIKPNYSALGREYGLDRHTIKKYHEQGGIIHKKRNGLSVCDKYLDETKELLSKPGITVKAVYEYLYRKYSENGIFDMTYSNFRVYLWKKDIKSKKCSQEAHVRYESKPGEQLQMDWKENLKITTKNGEIIEFNLLTCTLGYSRLHTFVYSETRTSEDLIRCLVETLKLIGGVPQKVLTDNMSSVVNFYNGKKHKRPQIVQFEKDIGFKIQLCKVRTPQTKGKDESANRFANWLMAYDGKIEDKNELLEIIEHLNQRVNVQINQTTKIPPLTLFKKEKEYLSPLPNKILLENYIAEVRTQIVPPTLLVNFNGSGYSTPKQFIGKRIKIIHIEDKLYIYHNTQIVAIHTISSQKFNYEKEHYIDALKDNMTWKEIDEIEEMATTNLELFKNLGE
jgi:transposase